MGLLDFLLGLSEDPKKGEKSKKKKALEYEMNIYGLNDSEKEIVRKGEADPCDFDETDLEEGDYYEDDID